MKHFSITMLSLLTASGLVLAQDQPGGAWRKFGGQPQGQSADQPAPPEQPSRPVPPQLAIQPGTYLTVRVDQPLSSDQNQVGDAFSATLVKPLVVDGVVVAERGQTIGGRVAEAQKAGRVQGVSRLAVQLTDLSLVDGQQLPIQTQLVGRTASTSVGRDAGAIAGTTAVGAAAGAAADWGRGAAIGAGAGAAAGIIGVLLTRGHPTVIYPESVLTFKIEKPVAISTDRAPQAFRYVEPDDYSRPATAQVQSRPPMLAPRPAYYPPPPYFYGPGYYPYSPYWGTGIYFGPGFYYGYGHRGFRRW